MTNLVYARTTNGTPVTWTLFDENGRAKNGLIVGGAGSGKTVALTTLAEAASTAGHTVLYVDPHTPDPHLERAATRLIHPRNLGKTIDSGNPAVVMVDEASVEFADDHHAAIWEAASKAPNIALIFALNNIYTRSRKHTHPWRSAVRESAATDNLLAMRMTELGDPFYFACGASAPIPNLSVLTTGSGFASHDGSVPIPVTVTMNRLQLT